MNLEDLTRELERTKLKLDAAETALEDIEEVCDGTPDVKVESGAGVTFRRAEPEFRLKLIKRRLARYRAGQ
ncbi:hypothetical protein ABE494_02455 [Stenotrophomonas lactitubi]|uniref:hypothetical protein n=1 Tax=Stenotrophomonas lactitubi TaxID=2045214 RepID=UPI00320B1463